MNKIALITDSHFGARGNHLGFLDYFKRFFDDVFFPELFEREIKTIIHLGDLVDNRKNVNFYTANVLRNSFLDKLDKFETHIIVGNHDSYHKNTNQINALNELVINYNNIHVWSNPTMFHLVNQPVLLLPWINSENHEMSIDYIENAKCNYVFGHLELSGFEMNLGTIATHGLDAKLFAKYTAVFSGHYHHKSSRNNIYYLGAPYEMTWGDYNDPRGFHILDLSMGDLEFIPNPYKMFHKIIYDDSNEELQNNILELDFQKYHKRYLKIIILKKENPYVFEQFLDKIETVDPYDVQIVENHASLEFEDADLIEGAQDTMTILKNSVTGMSDNVNKEELVSVFQELYSEANLINI